MKQNKDIAYEEIVAIVRETLSRYGFELQENDLLGRIEIDMYYIEIDRVTFFYHNHWWEMKGDFIDTDGTHYYQFKIIQQ